ncbi:MAG: hypothetical protein ACM3UU_02620 [Ignavibacteriales bacterium]
MQVKGTAFISRRDETIKKFGQDAWDKFIEDVSKKIPFFSNSILTTTLIPLSDFLKLQDEFLKTFHNGNEKAFWEMGEASAQFSLTEGPYKPYLSSGNINEFITSKLPLVFKAYYVDCGKFEATIEGNKCTLKGVEIPVPHIYFEYTVVGYFKRATELIGAKLSQLKKVKSIVEGDQTTFIYEATLG